jgi:hypothetical protein
LFFWYAQKISDFRKREKVFLLILGAVTPRIVFELYKLVGVGGWKNYLTLVHEELYFVRTGASGVSTLLSNHIWATALRNAQILAQQFGGVLGLVIFLGLWIVAVFLQRKSRLLNAFSFSNLTVLLWWLLLSQSGWTRHMAAPIAGIYLTILLAGCAKIDLKFVRVKRIGMGLFLFCLITQISVCWDGLLSALNSGRLVQYRRVLSFLEGQNGKELFGCGMWLNYDLEYGLKEVGNFKDCLGPEFTKAIKADRALLVKSEYWNWEQNEDIFAAEKKCSRKIFESKPFSVFECVE